MQQSLWGAYVVGTWVKRAMVCVALLLATPAAAQAPDLSGPLPSDSRLKTGVLPNGLRYAVLRSATPKGAVSIRFAIDVGSYEEADGERGLAHFVEHMAFRATRNFPEGVVEQQLAEIGVGAGRDHNAFTSLYSTLYVVDLPDGDRAHLDLAFRWLRDVADGVAFDPVAVDHERGVILAEREARNTNAQAADDRIAAFQSPALRSVNREPIGLDAVLRSARPEDLRRFYAHWYRPDTAIVVVTGDLAPETMEGWIRTAFETWTATAPPPRRTALDAPDPKRGLDAISLADTRLDDRLRVCRLLPGDPKEQTTAEGRARMVRRNLWLDILDQRLLDRADRDGELVDAGAWSDGEDRDVRRVCLEASPNPGAWETALGALNFELRRLRRDGPSETEIEAALGRVRADLRGSISAAPTELTADLAGGITNSMLAGLPFSEPRVVLSALGRAAENLVPADLKAAVSQDWSGAGPMIDATGTNPPSREALLAAWTAAEAGAEPPPFVDSPQARWAYDRFGEPGRVSRREAQAGFVRVTFRNGVVLNVKPTTFAKESVEVRITLGDGRGEIPPSDVYKTRIAADLLLTGGLGRQSWREVDAALAPIDWAFSLWVGEQAFTLSASPMTSNLDLQLQVLTAYLSDPGFRAQPAARLKAAVDQTYRAYDADPVSVAQSAVFRTFAPSSGLFPPPRAEFGALSSADIDRLLRRPLTASPLEVTIVGDVDEKTATDLVARTLGALPPRTSPSRRLSEVGFLKFPPQAPPPLRLTHQGPADKALVELVWPLAGAEPLSRRDMAIARLLADILTDALTHEVRNRQGRTYSPSFSAHTPDDGDQGVIEGGIETYPADADTVRAEALRVAGDLARGGITAAQLEAARKPAQSAFAGGLQTNAVWADHLAGSARFPQRVKDLEVFPRLTAEISLEEVRAAAARWLAPAPIQLVVTPGPKEAP